MAANMDAAVSDSKGVLREIKSLKDDDDAPEPTGLQLDDARKIFVSRVPRTFDSEALRACLERALGGGGGGDIIEKAEVIWDEKEDCNKGCFSPPPPGAEEKAAAAVGSPVNAVRAATQAGAAAQ